MLLKSLRTRGASTVCRGASGHLTFTPALANLFLLSGVTSNVFQPLPVRATPFPRMLANSSAGNTACELELATIVSTASTKGLVGIFTESFIGCHRLFSCCLTSAYILLKDSSNSLDILVTSPSWTFKSLVSFSVSIITLSST